MLYLIATPIGNLKEITSIEEVFKDGVDYMSIIEPKLKANYTKYLYVNEEEVNRLFNGAIYTLTFDGIKVKLTNDSERTLYYSVQKYQKSL